MNKYAVLGRITVFNNKLPHSAQPVTLAIWYPPHLFTTQLTNSNKQSPSSEASSSSAKLEIPSTFETEGSLMYSYDSALLFKSFARSIQFTATRPISATPTLKLSYPRLGFQSGVSFRLSHQNSSFLFTATSETWSIHLTLLYLSTLILFSEENKPRSSSLCSFLQFCVTTSVLAQISSSTPYSQSPSTNIRHLERPRSSQQCVRSHSNIGLYSLETELTRVGHEEGILDIKLNVHVGSLLKHCGNYTYQLQ